MRNSASVNVLVVPRIRCKGHRFGLSAEDYEIASTTIRTPYLLGLITGDMDLTRNIHISEIFRGVEKILFSVSRYVRPFDSELPDLAGMESVICSLKS